MLQRAHVSTHDRHQTNQLLHLCQLAPPLSNARADTAALILYIWVLALRTTSPKARKHDSCSRVSGLVCQPGQRQWPPIGYV